MKRERKAQPFPELRARATVFSPPASPTVADGGAPTGVLFDSPSSTLLEVRVLLSNLGAGVSQAR